MTQDEIIEMANKAFDESSFTDAELLRFAKLIAEKAVAYEREACAVDAAWCIQNYIEQHIPERIRARGQP